MPLLERGQPKRSAVIYCRVSSQDQVENTSLKTQEERSREYAKSLGVEVVRVFVEKGESAKTANRTEFMKALAFCSDRKKDVGYFIVYKLDRFSRNQDDHVSARAMLRRMGTELRSATEPINETAVGRAMEGMISVFAEFDNNVRTERTKSGMMERVKQGVWVWPHPIGYTRTTHSQNIVPDPNHAQYIKFAFEEYAKGVYTYKSLASLLSERGMRTRYGKVPSAQLLEKILHNQLYCGIISVEGWCDDLVGSFEPLVSKELFDKCQPETRQNLFRRSKNPSFPLRKLIKCSNCQTSLTGSHSTGREGKKYSYYHHHKAECDASKSIPKETLELLFIEYLQEISPNPDYLDLFRAIVLDIWKENYKKHDSNNLSINNQIEKLTQERQKVFQLHREGAYSLEEFEEQKNYINHQISTKRSMLEENHIEEINMEEMLSHCYSYIRNTGKSWLNGDFEQKIGLQNLVFKETIPFDGQKLGNAKLSLIYQMNQEYSGSKSRLVAPRGIEPRLPA